MAADTLGPHERPSPQTLMAAVIRLMAVCVDSNEVNQMRTLLTLLRELRAHPDLLRQPAVLASLATANAIWVGRLSQLFEAEARPSTAEHDEEYGRRVH